MQKIYIIVKETKSKNYYKYQPIAAFKEKKMAEFILSLKETQFSVFSEGWEKISIKEFKVNNKTKTLYIKENKTVIHNRVIVLTEFSENKPEDGEYKPLKIYQLPDKVSIFEGSLYANTLLTITILWISNALDNTILSNTIVIVWLLLIIFLSIISYFCIYKKM